MNLIKNAKEHLILYHPFFAYLSLQIDFIEDTSVSKTSIDGLIFRYNPDYIKSLTVPECAGLIAHGMAHVLLLHPLRSYNKTAQRWDKATDYAVNCILKEAGIEILNDLYDTKFKNESAEDIYEVLEEQEENNTQSNEANDGNGEAGGSDNASDRPTSGQSSPDRGSNEQQETDNSDICEVEAPRDSGMSEQEQESIITQKIMDAAMQAEFCGSNLGDSIKQVIAELKEPKKNWRELLFRFFAEYARNDYNWEYPDLSYLQRNLYIPSLHSLEIGGIIFALDTSGSVYAKVLNAFLSELREAVEQLTNEVTVIHCDIKVRKVEEVQTEDIQNIKPEGGYGTKFSPVFEYIAENDLNPKALVYFTDGYCSERLIEPDYPVIWCVYDYKNFIAPFGESVFIDN